MLSALFLLLNSAFADMRLVTSRETFSVHLDWPDDHPIYFLDFLGCAIKGEVNSYSCEFAMKMRGNKPDDSLIRLSDFAVACSDGSTAISNSVFINSDKYYKDTRPNLKPDISYKLIVNFDNPVSLLQPIKQFDIGYKDRNGSWVRMENVSILGRPQPVTSLPVPQPALNPKQYLIFNAVNGFGSLSGVSLNGGLYDVNLQGCRLTDGGMAACTLTLTPMRANPQDVTLEDLNVAVNGATVTATATATPTVMTLTVTAPVKVSRIDELRLGDARFLNIAVK